MAFPTTGVLDDFTRSNANDLGANWTDDFVGGVGTGWRIVSNQAQTDNTNFFESSYWNVSTFGPNCELYCTVRYSMSDTTRLELWGRIANPGGSEDGYIFRMGRSGDSLGFGWEKNVAGVNTAIGSDWNPGATLVSGDKAGFEIVGTELQAYLDTGSGWEAQPLRSDSSITAAGFIGMRARDAATIDDFGGGTFVTNPEIRSITFGETNITVPSDTVAGDWLLVFTGMDSGTESDPAPTVASGGGAIGNHASKSGNDHWSHINYRVAVSGDISQTLTWTGTAKAVLIVVKSTQGPQSSPPWASSSELGGTFTHTLPTIAVGLDFCTAIACWIMDSSTNSADPWTTASTWTAVGESGITGSTGSARMGISVQSKQVNSGSLSGVQVDSYQGQESSEWVVVFLSTLAVEPDPPVVKHDFSNHPKFKLAGKVFN